MSGLSPAPMPTPARPAGIAGGALTAVAALALVVLVAVTAASYRRSPDVGGLLSGIFAGLVAALILAAALGWGLVRLISPGPAAVLDLAKAGRLERLLAPVLAELEATRVEILHQVNARLSTRLPLGVAAGVVFWIISQFGTDPPDVFQLLEFGGVGGLLGYFWASYRLSQRYRSLYKARVLPRLAAQFGALSYRPAVTPDMDLLRAQKLFRRFDQVAAEDEIFGTYRGMVLNIVEVELTCGSGKERQVEFNGLLTTVELPRHLAGTTAVIADGGMFGNLRDRFQGKQHERVRVEDLAFEKDYEVYGSDQVAARALLTPAFIERMLELGRRQGFTRPTALAQDNRLTIALPKSGRRDLFEPPGYRQPARSQKALLDLYADVQAVLRTADAVIDLDQFARNATPAVSAIDSTSDRPARG